MDKITQPAGETVGKLAHDGVTLAVDTTKTVAKGTASAVSGFFRGFAAGWKQSSPAAK